MPLYSVGVDNKVFETNTVDEVSWFLRHLSLDEFSRVVVCQWNDSTAQWDKRLIDLFQ